MARPKTFPNKQGDIVASKGSPVPPLPTLLSHLKAGLSAADIARMYGCASVSVYQAVKRNGIDIKALRQFQSRKGDVLSHLQMVVTNAMPGKVENTSLRDLATTFNILHNAERLERGQSTSNVSLAAVTGQIDELDSTIEELEKKLGLKGTEDAKPEEPES